GILPRCGAVRRAGSLSECLAESGEHLERVLSGGGVPQCGGGHHPQAHGGPELPTGDRGLGSLGRGVGSSDPPALSVEDHVENPVAVLVVGGVLAVGRLLELVGFEDVGHLPVKDLGDLLRRGVVLGGESRDRILDQRLVVVVFFRGLDVGHELEETSAVEPGADRFSTALGFLCLYVPTRLGPYRDHSLYSWLRFAWILATNAASFGLSCSGPTTGLGTTGPLP